MLTEPTTRDDVLQHVDRVTRWLRYQAQYVTLKVGGESFYVAQVPPLFQEWLLRVVEDTIGGQIESSTLIVGRCSTERHDSGVRIHSDYDMACTHAWVWYATDPPEGPDPIGGDSYGTAFYNHHELGPRFTGTHESHNCLIREESHDLSRWTLRSVLPMKRNRLSVYPSDLFHSRLPHAGWGQSQQDGRVTIVGFCTVKGYDGKAMDSERNQETGSTTEESRHQSREDDSREDTDEGSEGRR